MSITKTPASMIDPSGATNGQVLTYNESTTTWVASAAPTGGGGSNNYTTVGNASAGIFVSAVCFIPSDPGTGEWEAPAGCYTARVTLVGGGAGLQPSVGVIYGGGRSHFNYETGSTTGPNQMFAEGGAASIPRGGSAGWNGINGKALGGTGGGAAGSGASGGGGYGGGGGASGARGGGSYGGTGHSLADGGSGGVGGDGRAGAAGGDGGGSPILSYAATLLPNFALAFSQNPGRGNNNSLGTTTGGGGGAWCSAIVSVVPGQKYPYSVGAAGGSGASIGSYGMVVIEW